MKMTVNKEKIFKDYNEGYIKFLYDHFENFPLGESEKFENPIKAITSNFLQFFTEIQKFADFISNDVQESELVFTSYNLLQDAFVYLKMLKIMPNDNFASYLLFDKPSKNYEFVDIYIERKNKKSPYNTRSIFRYYVIGDTINKILLTDEQIAIEEIKKKILSFVNTENYKEVSLLISDLLDEQYSYASSQTNCS